MITTINNLQNDIDVIICLGKQLNDDSSLDWVSQERVKLAATVLQKSPKAKLIFTGGKKYSDERELVLSEAQAMADYLQDELKVTDAEVIIEDEGNESLMQLVKVKVEIIVPNNFRNIAVITDEIHLPRANVLLESVLGKDYLVYAIGSKVNLAGQYRDLIAKNEETKYKYFVEEMVPNFAPGDHEWLLNYTLQYQKLQIEKNKTGGDPSQVARLKDKK